MPSKASEGVQDVALWYLTNKLSTEAKKNLQGLITLHEL